MVQTALTNKRASLPSDIKSMQEFLQALGNHDAEKGLSSAEVDRNMAAYGKNRITKRSHCRCKCSFMPFFYLFLLVVVAGVTCADYFLYEYDFWYI